MKRLIEIRKYQIKDARFRKAVDFKEFETLIKGAFRIVVGDRVRILVKPHYYLVVGTITSAELRKVGRIINKNPDLGKFCKKSSTGKQLVTRVGFLIFTKEEFENVYHFYEGVIADGRKTKEN